MTANLFYLIVSIIAVFLTALITYLESDKKTKMIAALIMVWAITTAYKDYKNLIISTPKPLLVLSKIDGEYDSRQPSVALFFLALTNNGDAIATNIETHPTISVDNIIIYDDTTKQADIEPGVTRRIRFRLQGETFRKVWDEQAELQLNLDLAYKDSSNNEYQDRFMAKYKPYSGETIFHPGWIIEQTP